MKVNWTIITLQMMYSTRTNENSCVWRRSGSLIIKREVQWPNSIHLLKPLTWEGGAALWWCCTLQTKRSSREDCGWQSISDGVLGKVEHVLHKEHKFIGSCSQSHIYEAGFTLQAKYFFCVKMTEDCDHQLWITNMELWHLPAACQNIYETK